MGLLDDAIREHLDLKRRRGADPDEVARLEHEALGPVRREPAPAEATADETHALAPEERHEGAHGDPLQEAANAQQAAAEQHTPETEPEPEPLAHEPELDEQHEEPKPHGDPLLQPTTEFRVEDHHDEDDDEPFPPARARDPQPATEPAEDVLEETPEFLQETPEHDRLWFEQRPPRDFDFDG